MFAKKKWSKLEDDIIKAGVMKYGLNHWGKISSLLSSKTSRDCKERWDEINPKNTAFTKEETIQLLEKIKIFKNQWVTIANCMENKTAEQCMTHYYKILNGDFNVGVAEKKDNENVFIEGCEVKKQENCDYEKYNLEEHDVIDFVRARLENSKRRKDLKKRKTDNKK